MAELMSAGLSRTDRHPLCSHRQLRASLKRQLLFVGRRIVQFLLQGWAIRIEIVARALGRIVNRENRVKVGVKLGCA